MKLRGQGIQDLGRNCVPLELSQIVSRSACLISSSICCRVSQHKYEQQLLEKSNHLLICIKARVRSACASVFGAVGMGECGYEMLRSFPYCAQAQADLQDHERRLQESVAAREAL
eukprot:scaffold210389_cov13-Tisochrysis_lutea.AAC.1